MKIIILGNGFLSRAYQARGYEHVEPRFVLHETISATFASLRALCLFADVIVNCTGWANTRLCEGTPEMAMFVNGVVPARISDWCALNNKKYVHISTGCLYDLAQAKETDHISAHCVYTLSKWMGELSIDKERDLILRPRLLFNSERTPKNFLFRMQSFDSAVINALDSFTHTHTVVEATKKLLDAKVSGVFNVAQTGIASVHGLCAICKIHKEKTRIEVLRKQENIHLVNCTMNLDKLLYYYKPAFFVDSVSNAWAKMMRKI